MATNYRTSGSKRPATRRRNLSPVAAKKRLRAARRPHKRLLLHPTSVFGWLVLGVLLAGLTYRAIADTIVVTAQVSAPLLSDAATIANPHDGQVFTAEPITVSGYCPDNSYVKLYRNGMFSGVSVCSANTYTIQTNLFVGRNTLVVQDYNQTDQAGPSTSSIDVTYAPPTTGSGAGSSGSSVNAGSSYVPPVSANGGPTSLYRPLLIRSDYHFYVLAAGQHFTWQLQYQYGTAPFRTTVNWGDGSASSLTVNNDDAFSIDHIYTALGSHTVTISVSDAAGNHAILQLLSLVKQVGAPGTISSILQRGNPPSGQTFDYHWLWLAWPTYLVVLLMMFSFWLGERREFIQLIGRHRPLFRPGHAR